MLIYVLRNFFYFYILAAIIFFTPKAIAGAEETQVKIFRIKASNAQSLYSVANDLKSAQGKISIDKNTNSLIVVDYPSVIARIESVISQLDIPEKMVEVKVLIVEADNRFFNNIGVSVGKIIPEEGFKTIVNLIDSSAVARKRSQMQVRTLSNHPATLSVSKDEIFGSTITNYNDGTQVVAFVRQPVGNFLEVIPTANDDGTITIALRPASSELAPDGLIEEKSILTQVVVKNGDTVAIGGADTAYDEENRQGVLGLPLSSERNRASKSVIMFLTAEVFQ
ncbi:MAG: secretin N-terminal domain-containing protein [Candidatus Omnitrophica bacterium]|nr:secretin N-terminal domain-containing protein [Candidatus Omnitrophota bacterium]